MPYKYRCTACRAGASAPTRDAARALRSEHRRRAHGGLIPDGEEFTAPPPPPKVGILRTLWRRVPQLDRWLIAGVITFALILTAARW